MAVMRRTLVGPCLLLVMSIVAVGCAPTMRGIHVGPEIARCDVADCSSSIRQIKTALATFAKRHPDQPKPIRAVAYPEVFPDGYVLSGGRPRTVVELRLEDGSRRSYVVYCDVGIKMGCGAELRASNLPMHLLPLTVPGPNGARREARMADLLVVNGAQLMCSFGVAPCALVVTPAIVAATELPAATINDNKPMVNISGFGMCTTLSNPQVAAATSAAQGVLTPQPCMPVITAPWMPGSAIVMIGSVPALTATSQCMCMWGGAVTVASPGQVKVTG